MTRGLAARPGPRPRGGNAGRRGHSRFRGVGRKPAPPFPPRGSGGWGVAGEGWGWLWVCAAPRLESSPSPLGPTSRPPANHQQLVSPQPGAVVSAKNAVMGETDPRPGPGEPTGRRRRREAEVTGPGWPGAAGEGRAVPGAPRRWARARCVRAPPGFPVGKPKAPRRPGEPGPPRKLAGPGRGSLLGLSGPTRGRTRARGSSRTRRTCGPARKPRITALG